MRALIPIFIGMILAIIAHTISAYSYVSTPTTTTIPTTSTYGYTNQPVHLTTPLGFTCTCSLDCLTFCSTLSTTYDPYRCAMATQMCNPHAVIPYYDDIYDRRGRRRDYRDYRDRRGGRGRRTRVRTVAGAMEQPTMTNYKK